MVDSLKRVRRAKEAHARADAGLHAAMRAALDGGYSLREVGAASGFSHEYVRLEMARRRRADDVARVYLSERRARRWVRQVLDRAETPRQDVRMETPAGSVRSAVAGAPSSGWIGAAGADEATPR